MTLLFSPRRLVLLSTTLLLLVGCNNGGTSTSVGKSIVTGQKKFEFDHKDEKYTMVTWIEQTTDGPQQGPLIIYKSNTKFQTYLASSLGIEMSIEGSDGKQLIAKEGFHMIDDSGELIRLADNWPVEIIEDEAARNKVWEAYLH